MNAKAELQLAANRLNPKAVPWFVRFKANSTEFEIAMNANFTNAHVSDHFGYISWDGSSWSVKLNRYGWFEHTPLESPAAPHYSQVIGYQASDSSHWSAVLQYNGGFQNCLDGTGAPVFSEVLSFLSRSSM